MVLTNKHFLKTQSLLIGSDKNLWVGGRAEGRGERGEGGQGEIERGKYHCSIILDIISCTYIVQPCTKYNIIIC